MIDFELQRRSMVDTQLRPSSVTDRRVLAAMGALPRERFVPASFRQFAYMDGPIEVWRSIDGAPARYLLPPVVLARLAQLASVGPEDHVLDLGCATGYSTAVLARLAGSVIGVEPEPELAEAASEALQELELANASIVSNALPEGHPGQAPYDVIFLNGSVPAVPEGLFAQLKERGRLAAIVANSAQARAWLFVKVKGATSGAPRFDASAKPLPGFAPAPSFAF
jgi:protein-L-isoaspartate(D-aspartate) O-methyltransferase